ncbi:exonuclease V subunit gamma [Vibrio harveyi]|uniref:Exonuclease V subunit gamma n=2 Tax=Vibrio harveyi TaxID=669 RepID=A0A454CTD8_VIBHA|nr:exonuclease V subunit gamma [Vibrio harveyi]
MSTVMRTIICNSLQSFWDMADNQFLEGLDVHCVFPVNDAIRDFILAYQQQYKIRSVSFTNAFTQN